jgi:SAM-dependent methyltransferase
MKYNEDILLRYISNAPLALAFERSLECKIYATHNLARPMLDLGCGDGTFANTLFAEKVDTGADPDSRELQRARELGVHTELIQCVGSSIPKPDGSYNTVISNSVMEHIPNLPPVLDEVHRVLAPRGLFCFTAPSEHFDQYTVANQVLMAVGLHRLAARYRRFYNRFWRHYNFYHLRGWEDLAREAGFEIKEAFTFDPMPICLLNDFLVPFSLPCYIMKRIINRWTICPSLRRLLLFPIYLLARRLLAGADRAEPGGLVFMALTKK